MLQAPGPAPAPNRGYAHGTAAPRSAFVSKHLSLLISIHTLTIVNSSTCGRTGLSGGPRLISAGLCCMTHSVFGAKPWKCSSKQQRHAAADHAARACAEQCSTAWHLVCMQPMAAHSIHNCKRCLPSPLLQHALAPGQACTLCSIAGQSAVATSICCIWALHSELQMSRTFFGLVRIMCLMILALAPACTQRWHGATCKVGRATLCMPAATGWFHCGSLVCGLACEQGSGAGESCVVVACHRMSRCGKASVHNHASV